MKHLVRKIAIMTLFILPNYVWGQGVVRISLISDSILNNSYAHKLSSANNVNEAKIFALEDIKNNTPFLFLNSGVAPSFSFSQLEFEEKYGVFYYRNGCSSTNQELKKIYNAVILNMILEKYGQQAIGEVDQNIVNPKEK